MPQDRQELEKHLRAKAEEAIRKLIEDLPDKSELTMTDMENHIGVMGHQMMQDTLQAVSESEQVEPSEVICQECNVVMHKRGKRKKRVVSKRGEIDLERDYYVCPQCDRGSFPPG